MGGRELSRAACAHDVLKELERWTALGVYRDDLPVDNGTRHRKPFQGVDDSRVTGAEDLTTARKKITIPRLVSI